MRIWKLSDGEKICGIFVVGFVLLMLGNLFTVSAESSEKLSRKRADWALACIKDIRPPSTISDCVATSFIYYPMPVTTE